MEREVTMWGFRARLSPVAYDIFNNKCCEDVILNEFKQHLYYIENYVS